MFFTKRYHPPGTAPGTLVEHPISNPEPFRIHLIDYNSEGLIERELLEPAECQPYIAHASITWLDLNGTITPDNLRHLGELLGLHSLALEDVLNGGQRPKLESYPEHDFIVMNLPEFINDRIAIRQISIFFGNDYIVTFNPGNADRFEPLRRRLRTSAGHFRRRGADYLLYSLLDLIIDAGFPMFEQLGERLESLEQDLLVNPDRDTLYRIHHLKRELLQLRRSLWPQREVINALLREEQTRIQPDIHLYLRDCYDHCVQIMDLLESYREMATGMLDVYLSSMSHRTNEVMRILTIIATVFIPLTFIVGVYGMNFSNRDSPWAMPELHWYYGYPLVWLVMILIAASLLYFFYRKKWL